MAEKIYIFNTIPKIGFPTTRDTALWDDWWKKYIIATGRSDKAAPAFTSNVLYHNDWNGVPAKPAVFDLFYFPDGTWLQVKIERGEQARFNHRAGVDTTLSSVAGATGASAFAFGFSLSVDGENISSVKAATYSLSTGELQSQSQGWPSTAIDVLKKMYRDGEYTVVEAGGEDPYPSGGGSGDPYSGPSGGHSGGGGGTGRFSRTGDTIGEHNVPTLSAVDAGFITLFAPTAGEMKALASYLWSDLFSIDTFKKIFANPMDAILGLSIVPVAVPTSGSASVKVGNISTGVSMTKASTQYVKLSCGSLEVEEYWGAYLDYSPYTKCEIYLPYIGVHELSVDDVMGKTVKVVYYIDILSGACTAEIYSNSTCLYSFVGQCSASIPITGNDWTNVINGVMQIGASIGSMVASGGLTAPISGAGVASGLKSVASASTTVASSKPNVERSGSMSGAGGMLGQQTPYLIITWPRECIPADQNKYIGYPSYVTVNLGEIVGFNIIESIHLENIPATSAELDEIESLLMNGVIF